MSVSYNKIISSSKIKQMKGIKLTYEKTFQGAHKFYAMVNNQLITMQYMFCTKKEALQQFKNYIKGL